MRSINFEICNIINTSSRYEKSEYLSESIEWQRYNEEQAENFKKIVFNLVKYKEGKYEKADYECFIYEYDEGGNLLEQYWRGYKNDYFTGALHGKYVRRFVEDIEYRDKYNIKRGWSIKKQSVETGIEREGFKSTVVVDPEMYEVVMAYHNAGFEMSSSCRGTAFTWQDYPGLRDGHITLAHIHFNEAVPSGLIEMLKKSKFIDAEEGMYRIESSEVEYNSMFPEIMLAALNEYLETK